ncbi:cyclopropane-fatty-acyl-phospholipid synthase family protein [Paucibacter sp. R3-3]|uniref:Cyclopropane-fatty-acyl-phospholipid synthase family protein n=1 Tax=Roseateles agri TaxID=3098619 RepID=A0ABU5DHV6_9BURK|nr:cyclopropane-fatty-acyl-phospholipid synthase family protein [Paucibacter sp. R3-3]MDY0745888.1 cyclopropane-fatty-acyl-phospholipid synthase family protein [Paucibacter sp. R3-3]
MDTSPSSRSLADLTPASNTALGDWTELAQRLFAAYPGALGLRVGQGPGSFSGVFGRDATQGQAPDFSLNLASGEVLRRLIAGRDPLRFAEAYFRGDIEIEGDFFAALTLKDHLREMQLPPMLRFKVLLRILGIGGSLPGTGTALPTLDVHDHSRQENRKAIAFHYDVSNDFYRLWLDPAMVYSCAYYAEEGFDLAQAQEAKLEHICRKLRLQPGERFLDIGCGWGALVIHAARHHGVRAHGITLSEQQLALARQRIEAAGLTEQISVELRDYRDMAPADGFDKISSVGMFEHVGLKNLPQYFAKVHELLRPGGLFLNHGITHDEEGWGQALSSVFINRYVFPDGELDLLSNVQREMELKRFEILDVEGLRAHYAKTLRAWVGQLEQNHEEALKHVSEATWRVWRLYMAACAMEFESGELGLYQILASKRLPQGGPADQPATRRYMYP